jgi:hypothetical protein
MNTPGADPYRYLAEVSRTIDTLTQRDQIEVALDEVEYLFEVIPPELQDLAEPIIQALRKNSATAREQPRGPALLCPLVGHTTLEILL